ncbi:MAG: YraN family protein [Candidatus Andersenbacteria bacterium]
MSSPTARVGQWGETYARYYLEEQGLQFITANWRCKVGEIDLIMQDGSTRVLVEVRLRRPTSFGEGGDTVGQQKQRKLRRAAQYYQQCEDYWGDIRFDVVSIMHDPEQPPQVEHITDAF